MPYGKTLDHMININQLNNGTVNIFYDNYSKKETKKSALKRLKYSFDDLTQLKEEKQKQKMPSAPEQCEESSEFCLAISNSSYETVYHSNDDFYEKQQWNGFSQADCRCLKDWCLTQGKYRTVQTLQKDNLTLNNLKMQNSHVTPIESEPEPEDIKLSNNSRVYKQFEGFVNKKSKKESEAGHLCGETNRKDLHKKMKRFGHFRKEIFKDSLRQGKTSDWQSKELGIGSQRNEVNNACAAYENSDMSSKVCSVSIGYNQEPPTVYSSQRFDFSGQNDFGKKSVDCNYQSCVDKYGSFCSANKAHLDIQLEVGRYLTRENSTYSQHEHRKQSFVMLDESPRIYCQTSVPILPNSEKSTNQAIQTVQTCAGEKMYHDENEASASDQICGGLDHVESNMTFSRCAYVNNEDSTSSPRSSVEQKHLFAHAFVSAEELNVIDFESDTSNCNEIETSVVKTYNRSEPDGSESVLRGELDDKYDQPDENLRTESRVSDENGELLLHNHTESPTSGSVHHRNLTPMIQSDHFHKEALEKDFVVSFKVNVKFQQRPECQIVEDLLKKIIEMKILNMEELKLANLDLNSAEEQTVSDKILPVFGLHSYFDMLNSGLPITEQERMRFEWNRLASFYNYTGNGNALLLARNGFYHDHTEGSDSTRCYLCGARHSNWQYFDNIEAEHRQLSPNCPFHGRRNQEETNVSITYEDISQYSTAVSTSASLTTSVPLTITTLSVTTVSVTSVSSVQSSISSIGNLLTRSTTSSHSTLTSSVRETTRSLTQGQASPDSVARTKEVTPQQPVDNDENRDRSLLALPDTRTFSVLGQSGETAYSHLTTPPRRNNVATGAETNAGLDAVANSVQTSIATSQTTNTASSIYQPNSISGAPIGAGAFGNNPPTSSISTTSTNTVSSVSTSRSNPPPVNSLLRPSDPPIGGGGRTDPTITVVVDNPKHPDYREIDTRITSFQGWPEYLDQTPRQMAEAGFFFVGVADFTRCFCCGGGLRNWEPGDDPMLEHTRWFPRCEYVNKLKGERYVAAVQRRHQEHMAEQQRQQLELAQRRDANREAPDPMTTEAASILREMGYQPELIRDAILTVRQQIGVADVTSQQVLAWLLDQSEGRTPPPAAARQSPTRDLGVKIQELNLTPAREGNPASTVINTTSTTSTVTSTVGAGSSSSALFTSAPTTRAESQQPGSTTSLSGSGKVSEGARNKQSGSNGKEGKESSSAEKQSAASGGESDAEYKSAEESLTSETKSSKKKTKKKAKSKTGSKSSSTKGASVDVRTLKEENEKLKEMQTCKICMDRPVNTTILPCGHLVCCDRCASRLNRCPICMKRIKGTVKTFMS